MPYIPHTPDEVRAMLDTIGAESILWGWLVETVSITWWPG